MFDFKNDTRKITNTRSTLFARDVNGFKTVGFISAMKCEVP
jgi:hypothetical protein